jgi:peptidoglycan hydrolase CwlO-like protein
MLQSNVNMICRDIHKKPVAKQKGATQMDYNSTDIVELKTILKRLQFELEDLEETLNINFTYTSAHIGGREVRKVEERLRQLKKKIARINEILSVN